MFTPEQQEAMAACLREIANDGPARVSAYSTLRCHGIMESGGTLAHWLAPPDDSVAWDHPRQCGALRLYREAGSWRYLQLYRDAVGDVYEAVTNCHPTEEAARKEWNAICRRAAQ